jgi:5-methylcytosine-specific restriction endonuclease McrA
MKTLEEHQQALARLQKMTPVLVGIDPNGRSQPHLKMHDLFPPKDDGTCGCGCGKKPTGRRTRWATQNCSDDAYDVYEIHSGRCSTIRFWVHIRDRGICASCGEKKPWEADHIIAVAQGGGGCGLDGFQTLCDECHKAKTADLVKEIAAAKRAADQVDQLVLEMKGEGFMDILNVNCKDGKTTVGFCRPNGSDKENCTLSSKDTPKKAFKDAFAALLGDLLAFNELPAEYKEGMEATSVAFSSVRGKESVVISGRKKVAAGVVPVNTPLLVRYEEDGDQANGIPDTTWKVLTKLKQAAVRFVDGQRDQYELQVEEPATEGAQ